ALGVLGRSARAPYAAPARGSAFAPLHRRSASFVRPAASMPSPAYAPTQTWRGSAAPRYTAPTVPFTAPTAPFTAPTVPFTAPGAGFTGSTPSPSWGGARSGFGHGNGAPGSFGGGHPRFGGGGGGRRR
ncbi:MAG TPA: hypothetical protein VIU64_18760, partial [Polyangia bacterium]